MTTEADKKVSEIYKLISEASKELAEVITNDDLLDEFPPSSQQHLRICLNLLLDAKLTIKDE